MREKRIELIIKYLKDKDFVKITKLQEVTKIAIATLHRDLKYLEDTNIITRNYGNVILKTKKEDYFQNLGINTDIKMKLAKIAASKVVDEMLIYIDAGTTTQHIVDYINSNLCNVTIVTNSISILSKAHQYNFNFLSLSGFIKKTTNAIIGETAINDLNNYNFDICFMGTNGVDKQHYSTPTLEEAALKQKAIQQSKMVYFIYDQTKTNKTYKYNFASTNDGKIICD